MSKKPEIPSAVPPAIRGRVLIVGVGGLGCPAALALCEAGVSELILTDDDRIALSNLPRQLLFDEHDLGKPKVVAAAERLRSIARGTNVIAEECRLDRSNARQLCRGVDFIIDGTDSPEAKFLLNDVALQTGVALSHAGVSGWLSQSLTVLPHKSACLRCVFPLALDDGDTPSCQTAGILGGLTACIGAIQAAQALAYLKGSFEHLLTNRLLTYDARVGRWRTIPWMRQPHCPACEMPPDRPGT